MNHFRGVPVKGEEPEIFSKKSMFCFRFLKDSSDLTVAEAIKCASENVANMLGETDIGTLAPGKTANLLVLTENFQPVIVIYKGRVVFKNGSL